MIDLDLDPELDRRRAGRRHRSGRHRFRSAIRTGPADMVERLRPGRFAAALLERVDDAVLATLPCIGGIDQYVDSADVLSRPELTRDITMAACPTGDLS